MLIFEGKYTTAIVYANTIDKETKEQIIRMINSPAINNPVYIMPDTHAGKGSVIGFTMKVKDKVIPNIVGVDIGCGMLTYKVDFIYHGQLDNLGELDRTIRSVIPLGFSIHQTPIVNSEKFYELAKKVGCTSMENSIGTLGGGNHFIEIGKGVGETYFITIHSGSRNFGLKVAEYWQKIAIERHPEEPKDLAYLEDDDLIGYLEDAQLAKEYASLNRNIMMKLIIHKLGLNDNCKCIAESIHNYIGTDNIIRKGAVSAYSNDIIILPFNRRDGIWIMKGKNNPEWNYSAPHGAGRIMSRNEAKKLIKEEDVAKELKLNGIFASTNPVDESPQAYKNPEEIQELITPTADVLFDIKPILNIKG